MKLTLKTTLMLLVTIVTLLPFTFLTLLFLLPGHVLNFIYISTFLHFYIFASQPLPLSLCLCLPHIYTCSMLVLCPPNSANESHKVYFYRINMPSYGTGGYFTPLTDFNAVEGGGFAGRRITLYLCSAIKDSGLSPPLHFSRNHLISRAFFRY